ncbi:hypothetical protein BDV33DRAFT_210677 [Aspergillus novoparasiticus]|uniref:Up-regulated during septation protein 1 domain-containing protein n=1 Tax=Aspergillus novoparasiticus TaxID=986946 RepID=A0A5N6E958_9EURO|nr:hypothetical protein BDV33DRAFT_210677 [Aspergillus novoparasiticus]
MSSVEHTDNEEKQQTPNQWTRVLAVLTPRNSSIKLLSKELDILKRRCNNAKSMTDQLRSDRDTLQTRLMRNLAEYRLSELRSKVVCQQVKLLGELDQSLDEWADTWRKLELQRSQVERLLLHHTSTVLIESQI